MSLTLRTLFRRKYTVEGAEGQDVATLFGPFFRPWTFEIRMGDGKEPVGLIQKKWSGLAKELFTEADNFWIEMAQVTDPSLRAILFAATRAPSGSNRQPFRFLVLTDGPRAAQAKALIGAQLVSPRTRVPTSMSTNDRTRETTDNQIGKCRLYHWMMQSTTVSTGTPMLMVPLRTHAALRRRESRGGHRRPRGPGDLRGRSRRRSRTRGGYSAPGHPYRPACAIQADRGERRCAAEMDPAGAAAGGDPRWN